MIGKREFKIIATINAKSLASFETPGMEQEESVHGAGAVLRLIASQVAAFHRLNPAFDARQFIKASGVTEDWLQSRVLGWAAQE